LARVRQEHPPVPDSSALTLVIDPFFHLSGGDVLLRAILTWIVLGAFRSTSSLVGDAGFRHGSTKFRRDAGS
jgi:hypothetical protein